MPLAVPAIEQKIDSKIRRAVVNLLKANPSFAAKYRARGSAINIRSGPPLVEDDVLALPQIIVQSVPERDTINRMLGKFSQPLVHIRVLLYEPDETGPISDSAISIVDWLVQLEQVIEYGTDGNGRGKIIDPDIAEADWPSTPPVALYLNDKAPDVQRLTPLRRDNSKDGDQSSIAVLYPVLITYPTQQDRNTRRNA